MYRPPYGTILFNTTCTIGKNMEITKLQRAIIDGLEDVKAQDIKVFNTTHLTALFDRVIVASGTSNRQTKALANSVRDKVKGLGGDVISTEGEEVWGDKPVRVKLQSSGGFSGAQVSVPDDEDDEPAAKPARKTTRR